MATGSCSELAERPSPWAQRGGYGGYYIPQASFNLYFGDEHWFRMHSRPTIYMGYPRFSYGGSSFMIVDPWPQDWAENWYAVDDIYIGYNNGSTLPPQLSGRRTCRHGRYVVCGSAWDACTEKGATPQRTRGVAARVRIGSERRGPSTASLVLGVAAAHATHGGVVVAGVAGLVAGAMSMAAGEYVSVHSRQTPRRPISTSNARNSLPTIRASGGTDRHLRGSRARPESRQTGFQPAHGP